MGLLIRCALPTSSQRCIVHSKFSVCSGLLLEVEFILKQVYQHGVGSYILLLMLFHSQSRLKMSCKLSGSAVEMLHVFSIRYWIIACFEIQLLMCHIFLEIFHFFEFSYWSFTCLFKYRKSSDSAVDVLQNLKDVLQIQLLVCCRSWNSAVDVVYAFREMYLDVFCTFSFNFWYAVCALRELIDTSHVFRICAWFLIWSLDRLSY